MNAGSRAMLVVVALGLCSCAVRGGPMAVPIPDGTVVLTSGGVAVEAQGRWRILGPPDGLAGVPERMFLTDAKTGELWVTYEAGAGATRLIPGPAVTLTARDGLLDGRVAQVVKLGPETCAFSYAPALNLGVSLRTGSAWTHLNATNSALRTGRIARLAPDAQGGLWLEYAEPHRGVARVTSGSATNYDPANSGLPYDTVKFVLPEPKDEGLPGDQVWFVTEDGLTRHDLGTDEWKHYGRRHGQVSDLLRFVGLDNLFTPTAIVGIRSLAVGPDGLWIVTPRRVYRFDGQEFAPVPADPVEGFSKWRYFRAAAVGDGVWVSLEHAESRRIVGVASYRPGAGWSVVEFDGLRPRLREPRDLMLSPVGGGAVAALAEDWKTRLLVLGPEPSRMRRVDVGATAF